MTGNVPSMTLDRLREFGEAWADADVDALMTFMTGDCVYHASVGPEPGTTYRGLQEVRRGFTEMLAYDHGRERRDGAALIAGDVGVAEWSFTETGPGGRTTTIRGCDIFEFAGGKIRKKDAFRKVLGTVPARSAGHESVTPREAEMREAEMTAAAGSPVLAIPPAEAGEAARHFRGKLACETDCADVWKSIEGGSAGFLIIDCRPAPSYNKAHIPGAISLPWQEITEERVRDLPALPAVTYCWGPSCNAATKGAHRLAALGRPVKEMIGGIEYWIREGHPTEGKRPAERGQEKPADWGLLA